MGTVEALKSASEAWISNTAGALASLGGNDFVTALRADLSSAVSDPRIRIVACGEWNAGKSSLLNALLANPDLLPVDVLPCSSYVTVVEHGAERRYEVVREGVATPLTQEQFLSLTARSDYDASIQSLHVKTPELWPGEDVVLVDTPGLDDLSRTRAEVTLNYLPSADVILLAVAAPQGLKGSEQRFVRDHLGQGGAARVIGVLTKSDTLDDALQVSRLVERCRSSLREDLAQSPWIAVSSRRAQDADAGNLPALRTTILDQARREKRAILAARFIRPATRRLDDVGARLRAEEVALGGTVAEAEATVAAFRDRVAEASTHNLALFAEVRGNLDTALNAWLAHVPSLLDDLRRETLGEVENLTSLDAVRSYINDGSLQRKVAVRIRSICEDFKGAFAGALKEASSALAERLSMPSDFGLGTDFAVNVDSAFRHLPEWVLRITELLLLDLLAPGGPIAAFLTQLGLDAVFKRLGLKFLDPATFVRGRLVAAIDEALHDLARRLQQALDEAANRGTDRLLYDARTLLDRRVAAIEAGLTEAVNRLRAHTDTVEGRRREIAGMRERLPEFRRSLEALSN